jgi:hypothetical protein
VAADPVSRALERVCVQMSELEARLESLEQERSGASRELARTGTDD